MNSAKPLNDLQKTAVEALRGYTTADEGDRTRRLRDTAEAFVGAREHFFTRDGDPDWLGRSFAYRSWIRETMALAGITGADLSTIQAAIRYHTGNVLRNRLDPDTLEDLGLRSAGPRERSAEQRERVNASLSLFAGGQALSDPADVMTALRTIESTLRRVDMTEVASWDTEALAEVRRSAKGVAAAVNAITKATAVPQR